MVKLLDLNLPPPPDGDDDERMETLDSVSTIPTTTTSHLDLNSSVFPPSQHNESLELSLRLHFQEDYTPNQQSPMDVTSSDSVIFALEDEVIDIPDDDIEMNLQSWEEDFIMPIDSVDGVALDPYFINDELDSLFDFEQNLGFFMHAVEEMENGLRDDTRGEDTTFSDWDFLESAFLLGGGELDLPGFVGDEDEDNHVIGGNTIPSETKFIENLPLHKLTRADIQKSSLCAVCMDEFIIEEKVTLLPCSHYFHGNCILPWLNIHNTCPLCRSEFPTENHIPDLNHMI